MSLDSAARSLRRFHGHLKYIRKKLHLVTAGRFAYYRRNHIKKILRPASHRLAGKKTNDQVSKEPKQGLLARPEKHKPTASVPPAAGMRPVVVEPQAIGAASDIEHIRLAIRVGNWLHGNVFPCVERLVEVG